MYFMLNARPLTQQSQIPFTYQTPAKVFINELMTIEFQKFMESSSAKRASFEGEMALRSMGWTAGAGTGAGVGAWGGTGAEEGVGAGLVGNFSAAQRTGSGGNSPFFT